MAIENICTTLIELGAVRDINYAIVTKHAGVDCVAPQRPELPESVYAETVLDAYRSTLRDRDFTILFWDGGVLQMAYWVDGKSLLKHRLLYQTPAFRLDDFAAEDVPGDILDILMPADLLERARPCASLRFDYDPGAARPGHAASHLTICGDDCRIPVTHPIAPAQFVKFIIRHYYPEIWAEHARVREMHESRFDLCLAQDDGRDMHVNCGRN